MQILICITSFIILAIVLNSIIKEEQYRNKYNSIKNEKKVIEHKIDDITKILKEEEKIPMYNRNSYATIRKIKEVIISGETK